MARPSLPCPCSPPPCWSLARFPRFHLDPHQRQVRDRRRQLRREHRRQGREHRPARHGAILHRRAGDARRHLAGQAGARSAATSRHCPRASSTWTRWRPPSPGKKSPNPTSSTSTACCYPAAIRNHLCLAPGRERRVPRSGAARRDRLPGSHAGRFQRLPAHRPAAPGRTTVSASEVVLRSDDQGKSWRRLEEGFMAEANRLGWALAPRFRQGRSLGLG